MYACSELIRLTSHTNYVVRHIHCRQYIQMDKKTMNKKSEITIKQYLSYAKDAN